MGEDLTFEVIRDRITVVRGLRVMLSSDLAVLYGVPAKALVQAVKRNAARFPADFMFRLTAQETARLRSQTVTLDTGRGHCSKYAPFAFTENGVTMLSSVLRSPRAVAINTQVVRAFVHLRQWLISNRQLGERVAALEQKVDGQFKLVVAAIEELSAPQPPRTKKPIGFRPPRP